MASLFGPLDHKKHCEIFKILSVITFILAVMCVLTVVLIPVAAMLFVEYYILRIYYGMCLKALKKKKQNGGQQVVTNRLLDLDPAPSLLPSM